MRRLLLIFLLTVLPLQASWAAVCAYCPAQCILESENGATSEEQSGDASGLAADGDCGCCQLGGVGIAASLAESRIVAPAHSLVASNGNTFLTSIRPDRPERPKWTRAA